MIVGIAAATFFLGLGLGIANGAENTLTVDGVTYSPTQISGPTVHYETPDVNPQVAYTERHVWEGNGSDNLPCEYGIHWIDNKNLLTVSHCLEGPDETTTTTQPEPSTTTTTEPPTTTVPSSTSTTTMAEPTTTTTTEAETTTTTQTPSTTTTIPEGTTTTVPELPATGAGDLVPFAIAGVLAGTVGVGLLTGVGRKEDG